jgi:hypothetical protein
VEVGLTLAPPPGATQEPARGPSGGAAGFERGQTFANFDRGPELAIHAVDPGVEPPDLGEQFGLERERFGPERVQP